MSMGPMIEEMSPETIRAYGPECIGARHAKAYAMLSMVTHVKGTDMSPIYDIFLKDRTQVAMLRDELDAILAEYP